MPKDITIVGMGTILPPNLSTEALEKINSAQTIFIKTPNAKILTQMPASAKYVPPTIDPIDQTTDKFHTLATHLIKNAPAVLLVPGDPLVDEASTLFIQQVAKQANVSVRVIGAPDILSQTIKMLRLSPGVGLQILDATLLCSYHHPPLEPDRPALITGLYHPDLLDLLKMRLQTIYRPQTSLQCISTDTVAEATLVTIPTDVTSIYIPPQPGAAGLTSFQETIAYLRAPNGCPWDREQTHQTLSPYLLEETYEVLTALDTNNLPELADELGDLLLQIVLHAQIASEAGNFQMADIIHNVNAKIIRRHPHVFGDITVNSSDEVKINWAAIKATEKTKNGNKTIVPSALDGVPPTLPALAQTLNISQKAVDVGFEWETTEGVLEKLVEEAHEIAASVTQAEAEAELGDFLFTAVNLARKLKVDPETALRTTNIRFTRRFKKLESLAQEQNLTLIELDKSNWKALWKQAKEAVAHLE